MECLNYAKVQTWAESGSYRLLAIGQVKLCWPPSVNVTGGLRLKSFHCNKVGMQAHCCFRVTTLCMLQWHEAPDGKYGVSVHGNIHMWLLDRRFWLQSWGFCTWSGNQFDIMSLKVPGITLGIINALGQRQFLHMYVHMFHFPYFLFGILQNHLV